MNIKTVTVIGSNGTMGKNVSAIFASFGNAKVYMVSRTKNSAIIASETAYMTVKAESVKKNCIPCDYSDLKECVKLSDLVFESVAEDIDAKSAVLNEIAKYLNQDTVIVSGTSGLSLTSMAKQLPIKFRKNYMGMHFFNPPYSMTLCELTPTEYTDKDLFLSVKEYASKILLRTSVEVKDSPGFLGNRIGFQFINQAMQYAEKYKDYGGIDYIDALIGPFSGRQMSPLITADFVGLDIHKAIVNNLQKNTFDYANKTFRLPTFVAKLIKEEKLGKKTKQGLYKTEADSIGKKKYLVYDICTGQYREKIEYTFPFIENMIANLKNGDYKNAISLLIRNQSTEAKLCTELLIKYIIYSLYSARLVGFNIHSADDVMACGFNWCPPLALIEAFSTVVKFAELVYEYIDEDLLDSMQFTELLNLIEASRYDYRKYLRAKK